MAEESGLKDLIACNTRISSIIEDDLAYAGYNISELMDNNAKSAFLMSRLVLPEMLERGKGVLIFTSTTGVRAATHLEALYCASKSAMHQLARAQVRFYHLDVVNVPIAHHVWSNRLFLKPVG